LSLLRSTFFTFCPCFLCTEICLLGSIQPKKKKKKAVRADDSGSP